MAYDPATGNMVLFGAYGGNSMYGEPGPGTARTGPGNPEDAENVIWTP
jgi:hypothetical protein